MHPLRKLIVLWDLINAARDIAPWVSASLDELKPGHTGEYEQCAETFLLAVIQAEPLQTQRITSSLQIDPIDSAEKL